MWLLHSLHSIFLASELSLILGLRSFQKVLRLSIKVTLILHLLASVALDSSIEVIILALRAYPATVGEVKVSHLRACVGILLLLRD
jgi:hypothetical protein